MSATCEQILAEIDTLNSTLDNFGVGNIPYKMDIIQKENDLSIERFFIVEWGDDRITKEKLTLDGAEVKSEFFNSPRITTASWSREADTLNINSKVTFSRGDRTFEMVTNEAWSLQKRGKILSIKQSSTSFRGKREITMIFEKQ